MANWVAQKGGMTRIHSTTHDASESEWVLFCPRPRREANTLWPRRCLAEKGSDDVGGDVFFQCQQMSAENEGDQVVKLSQSIRVVKIQALLPGNPLSPGCISKLRAANSFFALLMCAQILGS